MSGKPTRYKQQTALPFWWHGSVHAMRWAKQITPSKFPCLRQQSWWERFWRQMVAARAPTAQELSAVIVFVYVEHRDTCALCRPCRRHRTFLALLLQFFCSTFLLVVMIARDIYSSPASNCELMSTLIICPNSGQLRDTDYSSGVAIKDTALLSISE